MKTLLITGGAGFIGSNFIRYLLQKYDDYRIINYDKLTYAGNLENLTDVEDDSRYQFIKGDICDAPLLTPPLTELASRFQGKSTLIKNTAKSSIPALITLEKTKEYTRVISMGLRRDQKNPRMEPRYLTFRSLLIRLNRSSLYLNISLRWAIINLKSQGL
ncbi:dTDP-glucose 4,6-dehydratase [Candidatus Hakubella thermalkaliphila]|uniref:dTDP-glucose 4,6-dehydratase n=1 Tax=Candidatus Hakubella thermalkaliphila TaxID=2754717 RepID=A0A6V8PZ50_9ACTN|nr:GDP-mannose 4,6-dehydratase [Candidatus Hakubella thermalkaliphila]GFP37513.1 dTDP-glucose 4,6-dehydratase [Candidatus Hakubella thermalkaliphila]